MVSNPKIFTVWPFAEKSMLTFLFSKGITANLGMFFLTAFTTAFVKWKSHVLHCFVK